jgi:antitoxin VapB
MNIAKIFTTGRSQAVRLPKEYRFKGSELMVAKLDGMVVLYPRKKGWELLEKSLGRFTDDFAAERQQPKRTDKRKKLYP